MRAERHAVLALAGRQPYTFAMPVYKDLGSPGMLYCRSYGGTQMLVSEGGAGETLAQPDNEQGEIPVDDVLRVGAQVAERFPVYAEARAWPRRGRASTTSRPTGIRCSAAFPTFPASSSPTDSPGTASSSRRRSAASLAQEVLGLPTDVSLAPYALERFRSGRLLRGRYGSGAVS